MQRIIKTMQDLCHLIMRFSMQCKLIVEDATMKQARNMTEDDESIPEIHHNIFREINDIKEEFMILSKLIFKILNKRKGVDNSTFLSQLF
jgi:hypothetical protein